MAHPWSRSTGAASRTDGLRLAAPRVSVGVLALCADTDEEAERLASSARMAFSLLRRGRLVPVPPVEAALRYLEGRPRRPDGGRRRRAIVGSPAAVRAGLEEVAAEYGADELILLTITHEHAARRRSYELIAQELGLERGEPAPAGATGAAE
jgi:alkanesulfonate monooxygenase SsuD/methylene tetrahydromethanopterin reductase-like flavin-dependent oxidoreductase (luciferase family)